MPYNAKDSHSKLCSTYACLKKQRNTDLSCPFVLGSPPPLPYPLAESRVCEPVQPGNHEPPGEEETGLHPRADGDRGEIRGRPADCPGGNAKVFHITFRHIQDMW